MVHHFTVEKILWHIWIHAIINPTQVISGELKIMGLSWNGSWQVMAWKIIIIIHSKNRIRKAYLYYAELSYLNPKREDNLESPFLI